MREYTHKSTLSLSIVDLLKSSKNVFNFFLLRIYAIEFWVYTIQFAIYIAL